MATVQFARRIASGWMLAGILACGPGPSQGGGADEQASETEDDGSDTCGVPGSCDCAGLGPGEVIQLPACQYPATTSSAVTADGRILCENDSGVEDYQDHVFNELDFSTCVPWNKYEYVAFGCP